MFFVDQPINEFSVIPFEPSVPDQEFDLTLDRFVYTFRARWNQTADSGLGLWSMDVSEEDEPIFMGARIVLGACIGGTSIHRLFTTGIIIAVDLSGQGQEARFDDLGSRVEVRRYTLAQRWAMLGLFERAA